MILIMGHAAGKDIHRRLGAKIDNLTYRTPWNETFHAILKELYAPKEADLVVRMPFTPTPFDRLRSITGYNEAHLRNLLDSLCSRGGFLRLPPVKRALMSDALRSTFLAAMKKGASAQGRGWMTEI
jgi:hypothetical protein